MTEEENGPSSYLAVRSAMLRATGTAVFDKGGSSAARRMCASGREMPEETRCFCGSLVESEVGQKHYGGCAWPCSSSGRESRSRPCLGARAVGSAWLPLAVVLKGLGNAGLEVSETYRDGGKVEGSSSSSDGFDLTNVLSESFMEISLVPTRWPTRTSNGDARDVAIVFERRGVERWPTWGRGLFVEREAVVDARASRNDQETRVSRESTHVDTPVRDMFCGFTFVSV
ncbi:hypothetical protein EDB86DRAFT_2832576 [Lactarius hatsudake]|nr:hypothetical protein EDB86DRAFT_2832576 [Lactarius hatsudake]